MYSRVIDANTRVQCKHQMCVSLSSGGSPFRGSTFDRLVSILSQTISDHHQLLMDLPEFLSTKKKLYIKIQLQKCIYKYIFAGMCNMDKRLTL